MRTTLIVTLPQEAVDAFLAVVHERTSTPQITAEAQYQQVIESDQDTVKEIVPHTERITFTGAGSQSLELGTVEGQFIVALLRSDGSVSSSKSLKPAQSVEYQITAAEVEALAAGEPGVVTPISVGVERRAQLVSIGGVRPDFAHSQLAVHAVDSITDFDAGGSLSALGFTKDRSTSIELGVEQADRLRQLLWASTHVGVDGRFIAVFERPVKNGAPPSAVGWVWWLSGARSLAGFVKDELVRPRREVTIPLPALQPSSEPENKTPCECVPPRRTVPTNVTEAEVADNPGVYAEDPGAFCKPFSNPERVLDEKAFAVIARVQQPDIGPMGSVRVHTQHLLDLDLSVSMMLATDTAHRDMVITQPLSRDALAAVLLGAGRPKRIKTPKSEVLVQEQLSSGRVLMDAKHPAQWEDDIAQYQSASVALGHILEFRVRTRSNGYSLGNVASTLTLAPRQTKRIQKIEFERLERARREELTQQVDSVSDELTRERDYNDTVAAYLSEWATGSSSSGTAAAAGGIGFAIPPVVGGVGGGTSKAWSESSQEGARNTGASEQQRLRDAIRRHGDSLRRLQSTIVTEVSQQETITGTTEILRNPNYGHSLTVIYYQILRHLKVTTEFAGVRECLFVPFAIKPFTLQRAYRWREAIEKYLRSRRYLNSLKYLRDVATNFLYSSLEPGTRAQQKLTYMRGSIYLALAVERPRDTADDKFDALRWQPFAPFLGGPAQGIWARLAERALAERDQIFQREYAPVIAARWVNKFRIKVGGTDLQADCTLATQYSFNGTVRVDFVVPAHSARLYSRAQLHEINVTATSGLPAGSVATVTEMSVRYGTANFERTIRGLAGADDLVTPGTGAVDAGALLTFPLDTWDNVDERLAMQHSVNELIEHLNEHVEYYHKAIWWNMDRDRLFMLLDGFYVPGTDKVSIASVVDREPIAIIGNSLVYRVGAGFFLGLGKIITPSQLYEAYSGREPAQDPLLISLPTDGLYAQTIMDECLALEEHKGSVDWVLDDLDPDLGMIDPSLLVSRRSDATSTLTPTPMPGTIINLQNAPEAPLPAGLQNVLGAVASSDAFRDMAGLAGTQANAAAALQSAATLATNFGNQAAALKLAEIAKEAQAAQSVNQKLATVQRAADKQLVTKEEAQRHAGKVLETLYAPSGLSTEDVKNVTQTAGENGADVALTRAGETLDVKARDGESLLDSIAPLFGGGSKKPKQAPTTKADALRLVTEFRNRTSDAKFIVGKDAFATDLERLINNPSTVDQKDLFLCGPAAFLRVWIQNDPVGFTKYGIQLFEEGRGYIGSKKIAPGSELRHTTWDPLWADAAEWVTMSSLRDVENAITDYTGKPGEEFDGATSAGEIVDWLNATGLYEMVSDKTSVLSTEDIVYVKAAKPSSRVDVILSINANMLQGTKSKPEHWFLGETANHYIVLLAPVKFVGTDVVIEYWSWAEDRTGTKALTIPKLKFASNFYGWIQAWKHAK
jgi:hypothetical protein